MTNHIIQLNVFIFLKKILAFSVAHSDVNSNCVWLGSIITHVQPEKKQNQKPVGQAFKSFGAKLNKPSDQLVFDHLS